METFNEVAQAALVQIPPECRFEKTHAEVIAEHKECLLALEPALVQGFYETVYGHARTAGVFVEGERPAREATLANWWGRTVNGPIDDQYFAWMAMVGLVHVHRQVGNPMMLAMTDYVSSFVSRQVQAMNLPQEEAATLSHAFHRLTATVGFIITFGYDRAYDRAVTTALFEVAGMPERLFERIRDQQVTAALARARSEFPTHM
jgi:hypothetical protein